MSRFQSLVIGHEVKHVNGKFLEVLPERDVTIEREHRSRSQLIVAPSGLGKSTLLVNCAVQEFSTPGSGGLVIDPHGGMGHALIRALPNRKRDISILSLRYRNNVPLWPILDVARNANEQEIVGEQLVSAWRAQHGETSIGPRAEGILTHALRLLAPNEATRQASFGAGRAVPVSGGLSPIELLAALTMSTYRRRLLDDRRDTMGEDFELWLYWQYIVAEIGKSKYHEWAHSVVNKLTPLITSKWLRRATTGTPPIMLKSATLPASILWESVDQLESATLVSPGRISVRFRNDPRNYKVVDYYDELDRFLIRDLGEDMVYSAHFPRGFEMNVDGVVVDEEDRTLKIPLESTGPSTYGMLHDDIFRRRMRRGWRRLCEQVLEPKGVYVREVFDIADIIDGGGIVIVEATSDYGSEVARLVATFAILAAILRSQRQLALPDDQKVRCSIFMDEGKIFLSEQIEVILDQLRKAEVSLTMCLQHLSQLGPSNSSLYRGVLNGMGSLVFLSPAVLDSKVISDITEKPEPEIKKMPRGVGVFSKYDKDWVRGESTYFKYGKLDQTGPDCNEEVQRDSLRRLYQPKAMADETWLLRVAEISNQSKMEAGKKGDKKDMAPDEELHKRFGAGPQEVLKNLEAHEPDDEPLLPNIPEEDDEW